MPDAREAILNKIRAAIAVPAGTEDEQISRAYQRTGALDRRSCLGIFLERLHEYDAHVYESAAQSVAATASEVLRSRSIESIVVPDGFPAEYLPEGILFLREPVLDLASLDASRNVLTTCTVAIAHTGTIVLRHGAGEGARRLTLLPDYHLCIVREDQVVETVPEAFERLAECATAPLTFISGPSATADIEMTRIRGVHGPRFLDVILVRDA